jgi:hypothetical protein
MTNTGKITISPTRNREEGRRLPPRRGRPELGLAAHRGRDDMQWILQRRVRKKAWTAALGIPEVQSQQAGAYLQRPCHCGRNRPSCA